MGKEGRGVGGGEVHAGLGGRAAEKDQAVEIRYTSCDQKTTPSLPRCSYVYKVVQGKEGAERLDRGSVDSCI